MFIRTGGDGQRQLPESGLPVANGVEGSIAAKAAIAVNACFAASASRKRTFSFRQVQPFYKSSKFFALAALRFGGSVRDSVCEAD